ncbi:RH17 [Symbiodinium sp. KB8]|nr:RH17 [Symbiodinium sp. KB8]
MDDLSINISGLAPGAARTIQALGRKPASDRPSKRKAKPLTGRKKNPTERLQEKEPPSTASRAKRKREAKEAPETRQPKKKEPKPSKQSKVLEAWERTKKATVPKAAATDAKAAQAAKKAVRKPLRPPASDATPPPKKPKIRERREKREGPRKAAELKESGIVSETAFAALKLHESLLRQLQYLGFTDCTPIQALAVPRALTGKRDVLLRAPTGSGKTLAFLLPVLHQLLVTPGGLDRRKGTLATVLSPTKELALQTLKVASDLARMMPSLVCGAVAGGEKPKSEKARIRKGLVLLCATPGRLAYHLEHTATFVVRNIRCLVLDEADRLLDMGFEPQIRSIHKKILEAAKEGENAESPTGSVQTLLVSATLVPAVQQLADFCLRPKAFWADAEAHAKEEVETGTVAVGQELNFLAPSTLTQWYCIVPGKERLAALFAAILSRVGERKSIVFFSTGASVDFHCDLLQDAAWPSRSGGRKKREDGAQPAIKKLQGRFVGLAKDAKLLQKEDEDEEEEEEEEAAEDLRRQNEEKMFAKTKIFKLHGSLSKEERAGYIRDFLQIPGGVLLASDAASRGLDFPQIDWIIQYDPPQRTEEYLHRVGRTARIGQQGSALLFLQPSELGFLDVLRSRNLTDLREMQLEELLSGLRSKAPASLTGYRDLQGLLSGHLASRVAAQAALASRARSGFLASLKAYRSFPRELRASFPFGQLHLGHLATSFALREAPREVVQKNRYERTAEAQVPKDDQQWLEPFQTSEETAESTAGRSSFQLGISSLRGKRGSTDPLPCQDCLSLTRYDEDILYVLCDGHGPFGHLVAFRVAQSLPWFLEQLLAAGHRPEEALVHAFPKVAEDVAQFAKAKYIDISSSGASCSAAFRHGDEVKVAWLGDTRVLVATVTETSRRVDLVTPAHTTEDVKELQRARNSGAKLVQVPPNSGHVRLFVPGERYPGLFVTRAFGDLAGQGLGVSSQPEIRKTSFERTPGVVLLGSGGFWEMLDDARPGEEALQLLTACRLKECGPSFAAGKLAAEARSRWQQTAEDCSDDVSCILLHWIPGQGGSRGTAPTAPRPMPQEDLALAPDTSLCPKEFDRQLLSTVEASSGSSGAWLRSPLSDHRISLKRLDAAGLAEALPSFQAGRAQACFCSRRGVEPSKDCFSITQRAGRTLYLVCNGFGPAGHLVSFRVAQSLPKFLFEASTEEVPEQLVARAFHAAAAELSPFAGSFLVSGDGGSDPTGEDSDTASNTAGLRTTATAVAMAVDGELPAHFRTLTRKQAATELQYSPEWKFLQDRLQASPVNVDLTLPVEDREKRVGYPIRLLSERSRAVILSMYSVSVQQIVKGWQRQYLKTRVSEKKLGVRAAHCDLSQSGASVAALLQQGDSVHLAWLGESRVLVATIAGQFSRVDLLSPTHLQPDGLQLSRAFGHSASNSTRPDLAKTSFDSTPGLVLLGSGSLFESMSGEDAVEVLQETPLTAAVAGTALNKLCDKWQQTWDGKKSLLCFLLIWPGEETRAESPKSLSPMSPSRSAQAALLAGKARYLQAKPESGAVGQACPEAPTPPQPASPKAEPYHCPNCGTLNPATARFCKNCGHKRPEATSLTTPAPAGVPTAAAKPPTDSPSSRAPEPSRTVGSSGQWAQQHQPQNTT